MKKANLTLLILIWAMVAYIYFPKTYAQHTFVSTNIELTTRYDENTVVHQTIQNRAFGSTMRITPQARDGYNFAYWVVNGIVYQAYPIDHLFAVQSQMDIKAIYQPEDVHVVLFIDSNQALLKVTYVENDFEATPPIDDLPTKPGYTIKNFPYRWLSEKGLTTSTKIAENTIFVLQYESDYEQYYDITINNNAPVEILYNEIFTVESPLEKDGKVFSYYQENGRIISYKNIYQFTVLSDRRIEAVYQDDNQTVDALVALVDELNIREDHHSFVGQFELNADQRLIEYGFLVSKTYQDELTFSSQDVIIAKSHAHQPLTYEFLKSFKKNEITSIRTYLIYRTENGIKTVYSINTYHITPAYTIIPTADSDVPYLEGGWVATFADEFNEPLDLSNKWRYYQDGLGGYNDELQYYHPNNIEVSDGWLKLWGRKETHLGKSYTSAKISTHGHHGFLYGRIQVRAKVPAGIGTWPAIWMMPDSDTYGAWPRSGEIDIMEYVGYMPFVTHTTIHSQKFNHRIGTQIGYTKVIPTLESEFHVFEIIWNPGVIESYVDDVLIATFKYDARSNQEVPYYSAFPFDQPFHLILNLAIGGSWGGLQGVDDNIFPTSFDIDYVRYYQMDYEAFDRLPPTRVTNITASASLKNAIFWDPATDDYGVSHYNVYVNNQFHQKVNLNQVILSNLTAGETYEIMIEAEDFTGKRGQMSQILMYTFRA